MGRPRQHDQRTAAALLKAAERGVEAAGPGALSLRRLAEQAGTTTRAVYSLFGSKDGLIVALGNWAFELLDAGIRALPETDDPAADLVEAGITVFRRFALDHPSLFKIAVQREAVSKDLAADFRPAARQALAGLAERVARLRGGAVLEATVAFHALCEGLAAVELRGMFPAGGEERLWREALTALVTGLGRATRPLRPTRR